MEVDIDLSKNIEQNAEFYYENAKKAKRKIENTEKALAKTREKYNILLEKKELAISQVKVKEKKVIKDKKWYHNFRWFFSSEDFLVVGGRDATTNDIIIKKYLDKGDLVFHTELAGSPFFVIKSLGKEIGKKTIEEAAQATALYSRAWRTGAGTADVYCISPDQVKKELGLPKGAFMIYGKRNYFRPVLEMAIGNVNGEIIGGPIDSVKTKTNKYVILKPGDIKPGQLIKNIRAKIEGDLEEIQKFLPPGNSSLPGK
ncbi:DUF814 domain-containing protein [Candidatus Woesearchaeota archaeon]|nr:DUF814 domain-containing protein [Candidatus Woesearchaeota archaeon]